MKIKKLLVMVTALSLFTTLSTGSYLIHAEDDDTSNGYIESGEEEQELVPDYDTSGYEAWLPDYNPRAREMYGGYNRQGNFIICGNGTGEIRYASAIRVTWEAYNGLPTSQYFNVNGSWVKKTTSLTVREYANVSGTFSLKRNCTEFKAPIANSKFKTGKTLPAGTYQVKKEALEFLELVKPDGSTAWVSPQYGDDGNYYYSSNQGTFVDSPSSLSVNSVNGVSIKQRIMPIREDKRTGIAMKPQYVTIHNTASTGYGANAAAHANLQINDSRTWISWHYTVDNNEIYQSMPMNEVGYHAGDGQMMGNAATIGIEICENSDGNYAKAEKNAAYLTAQLLYENGLPSDAVRMHKDWSGKNCAHNIIEGTKGTMGWNAFLNLVKQEYERLVLENSVNTTIPESFQAMMTNSGIKFESGFVSGLNLNTSLQNLVDKLKTADNGVEISVTKSAKSVPLDSKIATGQLVNVSKGQENFKFMIVVNGDTNGDGKISSLDYAYVKNEILRVSSLSGAAKKAGDVNRDGRISSLDYAFIKNHILNISPIKQ